MATADPSSKRHATTVCESCGQCHAPCSNHIYQYKPSVDQALVCALCGQPLLDPVDTPCSHTFCYLCLRSHFRHVGKSCPLDNHPVRTKVEVRQASVSLRKLLDGLTVVCPNNAYCDRAMPRTSLEDHLRRHCKGAPALCPMRERGCPHVGPRCQLDEHLEECDYARASNGTRK